MWIKHNSRHWILVRMEKTKERKVMIYTDGIHLVADTLDELHKFANSIGIKRNYFHGLRKGHPHYDLTNKDIIRTVLDSDEIEIVGGKKILEISKKSK